MSLEVTPIDFKAANAFVEAHHRHHRPMVGCKFCVALANEGVIRGVVIVGRPVGRGFDDGWTLEVNRCCTLGDRNAPSMLYRAAWRAARALGYRRLVTYTLPTEGGASLRGAGFTMLHQTRGGNWNCAARPRIDTDELLQGQKQLWEIAA